AQRRQGSRLHGLHLLRGSPRAVDRACVVPVRAAGRSHACRRPARGAQDPCRARRRPPRAGPSRGCNRDARRAIASVAVGGPVAQGSLLATGGRVAANTLNILEPSVNNLTVRIFVRAAGLDFEEVDVWGKTTS